MTRPTVSNCQPFPALGPMLLNARILDRLKDPALAHETYCWQMPDAELSQILGASFDIDSLVLAEKGAWGAIRVVHPQQSTSAWVAQSVPTPALIQQLYSLGFSVVVNDLQEKIHTVFRLSQELGTLLVAGVNCNAYLTPPSAQGLARHYDDEDVIVVQVRGAKTWRVCPPSRHLQPFPGLPYAQAHVDGCHEAQTHHLSCGRALYIPRGVAHEAFCTDEASLHFTFSIQGACFQDLVREALEFAATQVSDPIGLRARLPVSWLSGGRIPDSGLQEVKRMLTELAAYLDTDSLDHTLSSLLRKRCQGLASPMLAGCSEMARDLPPDATLQPNPTQLLVYSQGTRQAHFKGGSIDVDAPSVPIVRRLADGLPLRLRDLPGSNHDEQLALACQLIESGLLSVALGNQELFDAQ